MSISIDLRACNRFAGLFNAFVVLFCACIMILFTQKYLSVTMGLGLISSACVCAMFFAFENKKARVLLVHEGEVNSFTGVYENQSTQENSEVKYILSEAHSIYSGFGCFLAFRREQDNRPCWRFSGQHFKWVFVPKYLLVASQYKSLCRHLIWHRY